MDGEYYLGQIITTGFGFVPKGFALCDGQLLPVISYQALFSLLGTRYGGNGITNFALPDLRGRTPVGAGTSADGAWQPAPYNTGSLDGAETVALTAKQLPGHTHDINATKTLNGGVRVPLGNVLGLCAGKKIYQNGSAGKVQLAANAVGSVGNGAGHENMQPFQVISYCIAVDGIYPARQ